MLFSELLISGAEVKGILVSMELPGHVTSISFLHRIILAMAHCFPHFSKQAERSNRRFLESDGGQSFVEKIA